MSIGEPKLLERGVATLRMKLEFSGPTGNVWHQGAMKQQPTISTKDIKDDEKFRSRVLELIENNLSPVPRTLVNNASVGQVSMRTLGVFLPDGASEK
jgi:hypothetical protein